MLGKVQRYIPLLSEDFNIILFNMEYKHHTAGQWTITLNQGSMMPSTEIDQLEHNMPGIKLPAMIYKNSQVLIVNPTAGFCYEFSPVDALSLCLFENRERSLYSEGEMKPNHINVIPTSVKVAMAPHWENRSVPVSSLFRTNDSEEVKVSSLPVLGGSEWTYTSPYKGYLKGLPNDMGFGTLPENLKIEVTEEAIPVNRLGRDNPIIWGGEVVFYEDELDDCGQSRFYMRFRAMGDCWYGLLRCYVRVDNVVVRIYDTRIFHDYSSRSILREFQVKESSYSELTSAGFVPNAQWASDPYSSDIVFNYLTLRKVFKDKISY